MAKVYDLNNRLERISIEDINNLLKEKIYDNKLKVAKSAIKVLASSESRTNHVILAASMQAGKTAVMNAICNCIIYGNFAQEMGIKKFIFATGMNDVELKKQTFKRALTQIIGANENNVCFDVTKATKDSKFFFLKNSDLMKGKISLKNSILLLDEVQYGTNEKNKLTKFLEENGFDWKDKASLRKDNLYIVSVSATPFSEMVSDTVNAKKVINIAKDNNYIGISEFIENDMVYDATRDDIKNGTIFNYIEDAYERMIQETQGCGIIYIRTRDFPIIKFNSFVKRHFDIIEISSSGSNIDYSTINNAVNTMINKYNYCVQYNKTRVKIKPIIVLIKGAFRCGVTMPTEHKDFTYMIYDFSVNPETTAQALLGRMCGYRDIANDNWKRTKFYVNRLYAEQYSAWEKDYSVKNNIPCDKMTYEWVNKDYKGGFTEISSKSCGNFFIPLTDEEIMKLYSKNKRFTTSQAHAIEPYFKEILAKNNLSNIKYDYIGETHLSGKNNYARSSQIKRFESFTENSNVFKIRAEKLKDFTDNTKRKEFTKEDLGMRVVYLVLDANIVCNEYGTTISGNKRLLVYYMELSNRTKVANRKKMFMPHKCTDLKRKFDNK